MRNLVNFTGFFFYKKIDIKILTKCGNPVKCFYID